jgi:S-adenosyl-L-methionine hydrolase (adenosine-forming)
MSLPSGIITLTTDLGHKGPFVAMMKGVILKRLPGATIIDVTHEIVEHWPAEAGFWLLRAYRHFPEGTVHLGVVDPSQGTSLQVLVIRLDGHLFLAPDNGLLGSVAAQTGAEVRGARPKDFEHRLGRKPAPTFHGRDVLAPLAADLASGALAFEAVGPEVEDFTPSWLEEPELSKSRIQGVVVAVDGFGNLMTNIDVEQLRRLRSPMVSIGGHSLPLRKRYADAKPGDYVALVNSLNVLEVARTESNAAEGLSLSRGAPVAVVESAR